MSGTPPFGHKARKRFGQNFLINTHIIDTIVRLISPQQTDDLLEIGPGFGALTAPLLKQTKQLTVIELDRDVIPHLRAHCEPLGKLTVINEDVLKADLTTLFTSLSQKRVVGNLPYNISTPLILRLLEYAAYIKDMHFMLQLEVVERLAAHHHTKAYGRLTVLAQAICEVEALIQVPPSAFSPPPKVTSRIVRLTPKKNKPCSEVLKKLSMITHLAFSQRRKQLRNTLGKAEHISSAFLEDCSISLNSRAEEISVSQYLLLAEKLSAALDS